MGRRKRLEYADLLFQRKIGEFNLFFKKYNIEISKRCEIFEVQFVTFLNEESF